MVGASFGFSERVTQGCDKWLDIGRDESIEALRRRAQGARLPPVRGGAGRGDLARGSRRATPAAFLIGNERDGLTAAARAACDVEFAIPMRGFSQSVNLSVATALCVYTHAERRRRRSDAPAISRATRSTRCAPTTTGATCAAPTPSSRARGE